MTRITNNCNTYKESSSTKISCRTQTQKQTNYKDSQRKKYPLNSFDSTLSYEEFNEYKGTDSEELVGISCDQHGHDYAFLLPCNLCECDN